MLSKRDREFWTGSVSTPAKGSRAGNSCPLGNQCLRRSLRCAQAGRDRSVPAETAKPALRAGSPIGYMAIPGWLTAGRVAKIVLSSMGYETKNQACDSRGARTDSRYSLVPLNCQTTVWNVLWGYSAARVQGSTSSSLAAEEACPRAVSAIPVCPGLSCSWCA